MLRPRLSATKAPSRNARKNERPDRRSVIVAALRKLMMEKGYSEISLTELALAAGMSVSHLMYYFPNKEAVLIELCSNVVDGIIAEITLSKDEPPEERIHVLVDHLFLSSVVPHNELGIILELIALSIHKPEIRRKLDEYNRVMMAYLVDLFEKVPRQRGVSARDAADMAAGVWMGFFTNSHFDFLNDVRARQLFRRSLLALANMPNASASSNYSPLREKSARL